MPDLRAALARMGLDATAVQVYEALLATGPAGPRALAATTGLSDEVVAAAVSVLAMAGLTATTDPTGTTAPIPPGEALQVLLRRRATELDEARRTVAGAFEQFRRVWPEVLGAPVEVVTGTAVATRAAQAWMSARTGIRQLDSPPYVHSDTAVQTGRDSLTRGVRQRVVYSRAALDQPGYLDEVVKPCIALGEQALVAESVAAKVVIIDDVCAQVSPAIDAADEHSTLYVVHPSALLSAIEALFELTWRNALPLSSGTPGSHRLPASERTMFVLLASGMRDDDIAANLGISRRTLSRRLEIAMARTGAANRFQLGIQAHLRGWI